VLPIPKETSIAAILPVSEFRETDFLLLLTRQGTIKKTPLQAFQEIRSNGICAINLNVRPPVALAALPLLEPTLTCVCPDVCVFLDVCVCVCARARVCVCVCVCVGLGVWVGG
jgi:DNA gyrase C-terminal domain, beta-propeller